MQLASPSAALHSLGQSQVRGLRSGPQDSAQQIADAREVQAAYRKFVGTTFYGQMLKAMRSTVGKPAYFHGGQAEETFRSQLDQQLADRLTEASAEQIADPMFRQQFPHLAALLEPAPAAADAWADLERLPRR